MIVDQPGHEVEDRLGILDDSLADFEPGHRHRGL
jgi:hypothetical protein